MNNFMNSLQTRPTLIVSLPSNSVALAEAAVKGGADALKVHIHVHHDASGTHFGTLEQEKTVLQEILGLGLPTGIVIGAGEDIATPDEIVELREMGFQVIDAYGKYFPAWVWRTQGMARMVAVGENYTVREVKKLESLGMDILEAAVVPSSGYGAPLMLPDLVAYKMLREVVSVPIVVPTQRKIEPEDVPMLFNDCRINALMIGAIVTGTKPETVLRATRRYKEAVEAVEGGG